MSLYHDGYWQARAAVDTMSEAELYAQLDALYGRDALPCPPTLDDLRAEARVQLQREFTDTNSKEYQDREFWSNVITAWHREIGRVP